MSKLYTCAELSDYYQVPLRTVWFWIRSKKITAIKIGKEYRITEEAVKEFEAENKTK